MSAVAAPNIEPQLVVANRYALDRPLARNSRITTWLAIDRATRAVLPDSTDSSAAVIVKLFRHRHDPDSSRQRALELHLGLRRGKRWAGLPILLDHGWEDGRRYMVFERMKGEPLDALSADCIARLSREARFRLAHSLLRAVFSLHEAGFLHLGITPRNVLIDLAASTACLASWGYMVPLHCTMEDIPGAADFAADQAPYVSAELLAGETADPRDDVFAIACIAYQLIGGFHPYRGQWAHKAAQLGWRPPPLHSLNSAQHGLLMKALSLERSHRTAHLSQLAEALVAPTAPTSRPSQPTSATGVRASRIAMTGAAAAGIALSCGAWQWLFADHEIGWTENIQTILPQAPAAHHRPSSARPAIGPVSPADAARLAAELNQRVVFGRSTKSRASTVTINETIIPITPPGRTEQSAVSVPVRERDDRT